MTDLTERFDSLIAYVKTWGNAGDGFIETLEEVRAAMTRDETLRDPLLGSPDLPPLPWSSNADRQPWPYYAADPAGIVDANGRSIFRRNWKETCAAIEYLVRSANRAALASSTQDAPPFDPTNHHNAALCPYCQPEPSSTQDALDVEALALAKFYDDNPNDHYMWNTFGEASRAAMRKWARRIATEYAAILAARGQQ